MIKRYRVRKEWRRKNSHNFTTILNFFPIKRVSVGKGTYGSLYVQLFNKSVFLSIGNYCSIAPGVKFIVGADHFLNHISTYPFRVKVLGDTNEGVAKGNVIVEDDVWIGENAIILSGVTIRQGAVIAAGAVVSNDVPAYAIVGGIPAKLIKYRFEPDITEKLLEIDYSKFDKSIVEEHVDELYSEVLTAEQICQMDWLPRNGNNL